MSKIFNKKIEHAAPTIVESEKLVSSKALSAGTFSSLTKRGGRDKTAGLNKLEAIPTKKHEVNKAIKKS